MQRTPRLTFRRTTAPTTYPVTRAEAKAFARIDIDDDDTLVDSLISRATEHCESLMFRQIMPATFTIVMDAFPCGWKGNALRLRDRGDGTDILLPRPPLVAVSSIAYLDEAGVSQTVAAADYVVSTYDEPGRIALAYGITSWPDTYDQMNAVTIIWTAGYPSAVVVPESIKQAILMLIAHWNENREASLIGTISKEIEFSVGALLRPFTCTEQWQGSLE